MIAFVGAQFIAPFRKTHGRKTGRHECRPYQINGTKPGVMNVAPTKKRVYNQVL
jgi:hypothetical protein